MEENSAKCKQISRAQGPPQGFLFAAINDEFVFFLCFPVFRFRVFLHVISLHDKPVDDSLYTHSGLFNRQGLDTVYEDYFVLLLSSPLLTTCQFIVILGTNRKALAADNLALACISRSIMMLMIRKRRYTLSQTLMDGRQVGEISCSVNKYDIIHRVLRLLYIGTLEWF